MNRNRGIALAGIAGIAGLTGILAVRNVQARETGAGEKNASRRAVIVELFTSEGCSSCPSADTLLQKLQERKTVGNAVIVPLSEHVDYWNGIGWRDPFSSAAYTRRQREYAQAFRLDSIYTPQMVVDGKAEFVGSDSDRAEEAIRDAARASKADVSVERIPSKSHDVKGEDANKVRLRVHVESLPRLPSGETADVWLAITENKLRSDVTRGENAGRRLPHTAVTRILKSVGSIRGQETFSNESTVALEGIWKRADLSAVAFVQERGSKAIRGAALLPLTEE